LLGDVAWEGWSSRRQNSRQQINHEFKAFAESKRHCPPASRWNNHNVIVGGVGSRNASGTLLRGEN
jgi:hypothetical protein